MKRVNHLNDLTLAILGLSYVIPLSIYILNKDKSTLWAPIFTYTAWAIYQAYILTSQTPAERHIFKTLLRQRGLLQAAGPLIPLTCILISTLIPSGGAFGPLTDSFYLAVILYFFR
jgi:hypothetical protein